MKAQLLAYIEELRERANFSSGDDRADNVQSFILSEVIEELEKIVDNN